MTLKLIEQIAALKHQYKNLLDAETQEYNQIVHHYAGDLEKMQTIYARIPKTRSRPPTIPEIFHKEYNENFLSDFLAFVLDPDRNGVGCDPLKAILEAIAPDQNFSISSAKIEREKILENGRIDLLIQIDNQIILGIEHKVFAAEAHHQTERYFNALSKMADGKQLFLIFLTPGGYGPGSKFFERLSYARLISIFESIQIDWKDDLHRKLLWNDFITHLKEYFTMTKNVPSYSEKTRLYMENQLMIRDLQKAYEQDTEKLFSFIKSNLQEHIGEGEWDFDFLSTRGYQKIFKPTWLNKNLDIHFEYWFSRDILISSQFTLMVDVERNWAARVISGFTENQFPLLKSNYAEKGILRCPGERSIAIAWKTYKIDQEPTAVVGQILQAWDDFKFLVEKIDQLVIV